VYIAFTQILISVDISVICYCYEYKYIIDLYILDSVTGVSV